MEGRVEGIIVLKGIDPKLDLGIEWDNEDDYSIPLCSAIDEKIIIVGRMKLNPSNFAKIKSYQWKYLEREYGGSWRAEEFDWTKIPRIAPIKDELIKVSIGGGEKDEDGLLF